MVMGGLSSIPGAVVCALILGVSESVATQFFSDGWKALVSYAFLLLTLWFFPSGLFGFKREKM
jgi:branched-chain amino acid transport system permease protein